MASSNRYMVIEFEDGVCLIPEIWMTPRKTHCYWPRYKSQAKIWKAIENQEAGDVKNWNFIDIKTILTSTKTFKRGKEKCRQALKMSDINTDSDADKVTSKSSSVIDHFRYLILMTQ
ncbi:hypothetical protein CAJAP_08880 [Camponotus japonicus]